MIGTSYASNQQKFLSCEKKKNELRWRRNGEGSGTRTLDQEIKSLLLYQLS